MGALRRRMQQLSRIKTARITNLLMIYSRVDMSDEIPDLSHLQISHVNVPDTTTSGRRMASSMVRTAATQTSSRIENLDDLWSSSFDTLADTLENSFDIEFGSVELDSAPSPVRPVRRPLTYTELNEHHDWVPEPRPISVVLAAVKNEEKPVPKRRKTPMERAAEYTKSHQNFYRRLRTED